MHRLHAGWVAAVDADRRPPSVVDPTLRVMGVRNLRVADASVMPNIMSGNTNAPSIMIGEKAAEMIAHDHGVRLREFVGKDSTSSRSAP